MMGGSPSKNRPDQPSDLQINEDSWVSDFEETCESDPELHDFNRSFSLNTKLAVNRLPDGESDGLSLNVFVSAMDLFMDGNDAVLRLMIGEKKDILKDPILLQLVEECLDCSKKTLEFCTAFDQCLTAARQCQFLVNVAVRQFKEEGDVAKTLQSLKRFKEMGDPFTKEFSQVFQSVYKQQVNMLVKLSEKKKRFEKKVKALKTWRKVSSVLFMATFVSVLILSVVAAAVAAPAVYTALAGALTVPVGSVWNWCNNLWSKYMKQVKNEMKLVDLMTNIGVIRVGEMQSIGKLVKRFELEMETMGNVADPPLMEEGSVGMVIELIEKKMNCLAEMLNDLEKRVVLCRKNVKATTNVLLDRMWTRGG